MIESYIQGATSQLIERAMALKGEIPKPPKMEFQALANECRRRIDESIKELRAIRDDRDFEDPEDETLRLLEFRRVAAQIDRVENAAIAAMARSTEKESAVASLLCQITKEIIYPIELPTASLLSQNYFYVNTDFQLLCIPLMELHFLLHLPDIYHELAHPLFRRMTRGQKVGWTPFGKRNGLSVHISQSNLSLSKAHERPTLFGLLSPTHTKVGSADGWRNFFAICLGFFRWDPRLLGHTCISTLNGDGTHFNCLADSRRTRRMPRA
jgi:hypothetical protein